MSNDLKKYRIKKLSQKSIDAEEIFLDSKRLKESANAEKEKLEIPIEKGRIYLFYFLTIILLLILFVKIFNLQIVEGNYWESLAESNRIRSYPIKALRGIIYDRENNPLVSNEPRFDLAIVPADLLKQEKELPKILNHLADISKRPKEEIEVILKKNADFSVPITIKENISKETALILKTKFSENSAVLVETNSQRKYINGQYFSHLLGYLGKIDRSEYEAHPEYLLDDWIGKTGVEFFYENSLRGLNGEKLIEVDSQGKIKNIFAQKEPRAGKDIFLSIDKGLQEKLYNEINSMLRKIGADKAAGVALNPNTGEILALVSFPGFDNNKFIQGFTEEDFKKISQNSSKPFLNRVISGTYPPGSTIKPLIAAAALRENIITPGQTINCTGAITVRSKIYPNIFRTFHDWKIHGITNIVKAIAESCNVYFYTVGGGYGEIEGLGVEKINYYLKKFGLGKVSGIDLSQERRGLVPDKNWKKENKNEDWYIGDTYNLSIGQGYLTATPIQIVLATAAVANQGILYKPRIVSKIGDQPILPQIIRDNIIDNKDILETVRKGMREAVISGSSKYLFDLPVKVAGKTGTAQSPGGKTPHAWFTGFAPYENPEIVLTILIENGGEGSSVAVPIFKEVLKWYFSNK